MTDPLPVDPAMAHALDRFDVPPAGAGFLERLAAMPAVDTPALPPMPRRRLFGPGRRGAWARRATIGAIAVGLASATAAATGIFPQLHVAFPAPIVAMLTPAPKHAPKPARHHRAPITKPAVPAAEPPQASVEATPAAPDPALRAQWALKREQRIDTIQQRLAARGIDVPKPVIRRELAVRQLAIGAAVRGDMTTPLPPRIARMRERAAEYLEAHPVLRDNLRAKAAAADNAYLARMNATNGIAQPDDQPSAAAPSDDLAQRWTQRRLLQLRRQQRRDFWAAQRAAQNANTQSVATAEPAPPASEGNDAAPR